MLELYKLFANIKIVDAIYIKLINAKVDYFF